MKVINNQIARVLTPISSVGIGCEVGWDEVRRIEKAARTAYQSHNINNDFEKTKRFVRMLIDRGHEACLEHGYLSVEFLTDRGVANELVRHRLASFTQESTRYCNYSKDKFGNEIICLKPIDIVEYSDAYLIWKRTCEEAEHGYFELLNLGCTPEIARSVLPLSLATRIVVTTNYREWRHIFNLRTAEDAHPQIRELMGPLLAELKTKIPVIFDDIPSDEWDGKGADVSHES